MSQPVFRTTRNVKAFSRESGLLRPLLQGVATLLLLSGCGAKNDPLKPSNDWTSSMQRWESSWHENSWIVALDVGERETEQEIAQRFVDEFQNSSQGEIAEILANAGLGKAHEPPQGVELPEVILPPHKDKEPRLSFAVFKPNALHHQLASAFKIQGVAATESGRLAAATLFRTLQKIPRAQWVEPDLESRLDNDAPVLPKGDQMEPWQRLKVQETYDYLAAKGVTPREINIAVLDTGVDSLHPALVSAMFENSREKNGKPNVDDDKNGYIDDITGIDATIEKGKKDQGAAPIPGSADLGGPGSNCPLTSSNPLSRNCGHGTHVAGIIAARTGEAETMAGVCQSCKIISLRVAKRVRSKGVEYDGAISDSSQLRAMSYLLSLADPNDKSRLLTSILNLSLGKYFSSRSMEHMVHRLQEQNVLVVAAAGNDDTDLPSYPAAYPEAVSVCALGSDGTGFGNGFHRGKFGKAIFSNFGEWVDICAPGVDIFSSVPSDGVMSLHEIRSGTSQATPFVAGALGLLLGIADSGMAMQAESLVRILQRTANSSAVYGAKYNLNLYDKRYPDGESAYYLGAGIVDLLNAAKVTLRDGDGKRTSEYVPPAENEPMSGCVMNSAAEKRGAVAGPMESILLLLPSLWILLGVFRMRWNSKE
jgi:subtilisin family serine protease